MNPESIRDTITQIITSGITIVALRYIVMSLLEKLKHENKIDHEKLFEITSRHEIIMTQYTENEAFFQQLENIAGTACEYIDDVEAHQYTNVVGGALIEFSKDILNISIELVTDIQIDSKASIHVIKCKQTFADFWTANYAEEYFRKYRDERENYLERIKAISDDKVNSKSDRFRAETILYMHTLMKNFVYYFNDELR